MKPVAPMHHLWWWPLGNCWRGLRIVGDQIRSGHPGAARAAYLRLRADGVGRLHAHWLLVRPLLEAEAAVRESAEAAAESLYQSKLDDVVRRHVGC